MQWLNLDFVGQAAGRDLTGTSYLGKPYFPGWHRDCSEKKNPAIFRYTDVYASNVVISVSNIL